MFRWPAAALLLLGLAVAGTERQVALKCYQCKGDSRDPLPLCDTDFWRLTTRDEKRAFLFQCPTRKSSYCVKRVDYADTYATTFRGCVGNVDEAKTRLREGCRSVRGSGSTTCLCAHNACNDATALGYAVTHALLVLAPAIAICYTHC